MQFTVTNKTNGLVMLPNPISKGVKPNSTKVFDNVDPIALAEQADVWDSMELAGVIAFSSNDDPDVPDQMEAVTEAAIIEHYKLYVDYVSGNDAIATGSISNPFRTIQAALNYAAAMVVSALDSIEIWIPSAKSEEVLVYHGTNAITLTGASTEAYIQPPAGQTALTVTNATPASLALYRSTGLYSDLVNQGNAGARVYLKNLWFCSSGGANSIEFLGVQGDAGPGVTRFGYIFLDNIAVSGVIYARNTNFMSVGNTSNWAEYNLHNVSYVSLFHTMARHFTAHYDSADPEGVPFYGLGFHQGYDVHQWGNLTASGESVITFWSGHTDGHVYVSETSSVLLDGYGVTKNMDLDDTCTVTHTSSYVGGNVNAEAGASWRGNGLHVGGGLTFAAGAGTARMDGGHYMGALTDPGAKFVRNLGN